MVEDGLPCGCGNRGCWEVYGSERAAERYYTQAISRGRGATPEAQPTEPGPAFDDILRLAGQGDARAVEAIDAMAHYIGAGVAMLATGLAPDVVVLVGDVTRLWERVGPALEETIRRRTLTHAPTRIVPADLSTQPWLRGTIALVLEKHFGAPSVA
jgi:predicted NBD/HSP70 family sugar kinase